MKTVLLAFCLITSPALASETSKYEQSYLSCVDYGHQPVSSAKDKACRDEAKAYVLLTQEAHSQFLSCVDYYHQDVSHAQEEACLKEIK